MEGSSFSSSVSSTLLKACERFTQSDVGITSSRGLLLGLGSDGSLCQRFMERCLALQPPMWINVFLILSARGVPWRVLAMASELAQN
jgi:hypothetical protein